ncbi:DUF4157 domain-containing protein [Streptomyces sp. NPDC047082]|uniref:eCIS core domain-containing protein n=1 Tax=Streptomyces sp. NPDC047082 TaxID=3155259 RepID=UPI0033FD9354
MYRQSQRVTKNHSRDDAFHRNGSSEVPEAVLDVLKRPGMILDQEVRLPFEARWGHDFSRVRVHSDEAADRATQSIGAQAFTLGLDIAFARGAYAPDTSEGSDLLAHELAHVIQQRGSPSPAQRIGPISSPAENVAQSAINSGELTHCFDTVGTVQRQGVPDAGPLESGAEGITDAGETLPGGVPPTAEEIEANRLRANAPELMEDQDLGPAYDQALLDRDDARCAAILDQIRNRDGGYGGIGVGLPSAIPKGALGNVLLTPDVALSMIENMVAGKPPFRPELGVGGASWFVTEGTPYTGVGPESGVAMQIDLMDSEGGLVYQQADLDRIYLEEAAQAQPIVETQVREQFRVSTGRDAASALSKALRDKISHHLDRLAQRRMWERIGREVAGSARKVGEVVLEAGGRFSATAGRFKVIADAAKIRVRGGVAALLRAVEKSGLARPAPSLAASAEELARTMKLAGRVRTVFRVGGKILIVVAVAADIVEIILAEDHLEALVVSASGWAGATAGSAAFTAMWTPADVAGPWAWAAHGVGVLVSGAIGYWVGSSVTRYVYRLVVTSRRQVREETP